MLEGKTAESSSRGPESEKVRKRTSKDVKASGKEKLL